MNTRITGNYIADERTIHGAESAVERILREGENSESKHFTRAMLVGEQVDCITQLGLVSFICEQNTTFDSYTDLSDGAAGGRTQIAAAQTERNHTGHAVGYSTSRFANQFFTTSGASFYRDNLEVNYATESLLTWKRWGPKGNF